MRQIHSNLEPVDDISKARIETFRCGCFKLIHEGYKRFACPEKLRNFEETDITGHLIAHIQKFLFTPHAPEWTEQFAIKENSPLNVPDRSGKTRPLVDMEFEFTARLRMHYRVEAKWIGAEKRSLGSRMGYLGEEGIGRFLSNYYPVKIGHAGMLAYVHSDDEATWAKKIRDKLRRNATHLKIRISGGRVWEKDEAQKRFCAFISIHDCPLPVGQLHITHLLLRFC